jgi:hypothetical protein
MDAIEVEIRASEAELENYISSGTPVAVTRGGKTVGYFIPAIWPKAADVAALTEAGDAFDHTVGAQDIDIEEIVAEFDALRKNANRKRKPGSKAA